MEDPMPDEKINGREPAFSEEDTQREQLGPRGVPGKESPAKMTPQREKKTPKDVDPGHTAWTQGHRGETFLGPAYLRDRSAHPLEEAGKPYELEELDVAGGETQNSRLRASISRGKVPTLVERRRTVLTEFGAIATWLARTNPDRPLPPPDPNGEARANPRAGVRTHFQTWKVRA
jgi:hypothetical protein